MERTLETFKRLDVPSELLLPSNLYRLTLELLFDWAVITACAFMMMQTSYYLYPLWALIIAGRLHALGIILHELSHFNLNKKTLQLRLLEIFSGYVIGSSANAMAYHHMRHHRDTLKDNDPYYNINKKCIGVTRFWLSLKKGLFFVPFWIVRSFVSPFALIFPKLRTPYARIFLQDVSGKDRSKSLEVLNCIYEDLPILLFHSVLLYLTLTYFEFLLYAYYFVIPMAGVLCIYRLLVEHEYDIVQDRSVYTIIESTFDHHLGILDRLLIGPHNIGYHSIHHIHPNVGLHHLPQLQKWYLKNSKQYQEKYLSPFKWSWREDLFGGVNRN